MSGKDDPGGGGGGGAGGGGGGAEAGGGCRKTAHGTGNSSLVSTLCRTCDCVCVYDAQGVSQEHPYVPLLKLY